MLSKYVHSTELQKRALAAGLKRSSAVVFAILGYWAQVPGGVKKGKGLPWKWRNYDEIAVVSGYGATTVQRAVKQLKSEQLIETRRMFNPSKPGETVNGFRLTNKGYITLELPIPIGANDGPGPTSTPAVEEPKAPLGNGHNDDSQQQETFKKKQEQSICCPGKKEEGKKEEQLIGQGSKLHPEERPATLEEVAAILGYSCG